MSQPERKTLSAALDNLDRALVSLCQGETPKGYERDPADAQAAQSVKDGIFDGQRNWCHDD